MLEGFENIENYLPLGSVVTIKGFHREWMIIGRFYKNPDGTTKDYCAIPYPEGFMGMEKVFTFNKDVIEKVVREVEDTQMGRNILLFVSAPKDVREKATQGFVQLLAKRIDEVQKNKKSS